MSINLGKILKYIVKRVKEPSTYAGLATIAVMVGKPNIADTIGQVGQVAGIIIGGGLIGHQQNVVPADTV